MVHLLVRSMVVAAVGPALLFVLASQSNLPDGTCSIEELSAAQRQGPGVGLALKLFTSAEQDAANLAQLPLDGNLIGDGQRRNAQYQLICDAVLPRYQPDRNWLGVYVIVPGQQGRYQCVDRFALEEAINETCWFYPTHDGTYLSWEQELKLVLLPGFVVDPSEQLLAMPYQREQISLLWSLLGDDEMLTSVGVTYGGQRVEWSPKIQETSPRASWKYFSVDTQNSPSLVVLSQQTS